MPALRTGLFALLIATAPALRAGAPEPAPVLRKSILDSLVMNPDGSYHYDLSAYYFNVVAPYEYSQPGQADYDAALKMRDASEREALLRRSAQDGHLFAQEVLAQWLFKHGEPGSDRQREALHWFKVAADRHFLNAILALSRIELSGLNGAGADPPAAIERLRNAVSHGGVEAALILAIAYDEGRGVPRDASEAEHWYRKAIADDKSVPMYLYGDFLERKGRMKNALTQYRRAAQAHGKFALVRLGEIYAEGKGVAKDDIKATRWYKEAATFLDPWGNYRYGDRLSRGVGVAADPVKAFTQLTRAANAGVPEAAARLAELDAEFTPEQKTAVRRELARQRVPEYQLMTTAARTPSP